MGGSRGCYRSPSSCRTAGPDTAQGCVGMHSKQPQSVAGWSVGLARVPAGGLCRASPRPGRGSGARAGVPAPGFRRNNLPSCILTLGITTWPEGMVRNQHCWGPGPWKAWRSSQGEGELSQRVRHSARASPALDTGLPPPQVANLAGVSATARGSVASCGLCSRLFGPLPSSLPRPHGPGTAPRRAPNEASRPVLHGTALCAEPAPGTRPFS